MIAKNVPARRGTRTFATGIAYVQKHDHRRHVELVGVGVSFGDRVQYASTETKAVWTHTRGVSSVVTAAAEMEAVAQLSARCKDPVQHEILAYAKHEHPTREQMVADAERLLSALDMADHQYVLSAHTDTDDLHAHIIANRIGSDGRANARWQDRPARERVCAQIAAERGWEIVVGFHNRDIVQEHLGLAALPQAPQRRIFDRDFDRVQGRGELPWQDAARPYVLEAVERATSWDDLRARLDAHGVTLKGVERGGRLAGLAFAEGLAPDAPGCAASRIDARCKLSALEARFGAYGAPERTPIATAAQRPEKPGLWQEQMRPAILAAVDAAASWDDLRARLSEVGVVVKGVERGGRLRGLAFAAGSGEGEPGCAASRIDDRCKRSALEARLGPFPDAPREASPQPHARAVEEEVASRAEAAAAEAERTRESLRARVEREAAATSWVLERARGIAENARLREEYGSYRDAFYEARRERSSERREESWSQERELRRAESERRFEAKQMQRAVVRAITPRGVVRRLGYGVVEHLHEQRTERERAQARERWERVRVRERLDAWAVPALRYRDFVAQRAEAGDEGAQRVRAYLDRAVHTPSPEREAVPERTQSTQAIRREHAPIDAMRDDFVRRLAIEAAQARSDAGKMPAFLELRARHEKIEAALGALEGRGHLVLEVERLAGLETEERFAQVERALFGAAASADDGGEAARRASALEAQHAAAHERRIAALEGQPYAQLRAELDELDRRLAAQASALERERAALVVPPEGYSAANLIGVARLRAVSDAQEQVRPYTPQERDAYEDILRRKASWNPLARLGVERAERAFTERYNERIARVGTEAGKAFDASGEPARITARFNADDKQRRASLHRSAAISEHTRGIVTARELAEGFRQDLDALEARGIPAPAFDPAERRRRPDAVVERMSKTIEKTWELARVIERGGETREISATALRWELEPIAQGEARGYSEEERKVALAFLKQIERLEPNARIEVARDVRQEFQRPGALAARLEKVERTQARERERGRERDFGMER